jgi:hypothetical protein
MAERRGSKNDNTKHEIVPGPRQVRAHSAKVDTGFALECAPNHSKSTFSSREPVSTSFENALSRSAYLRAAQAYMLISMPTGTSTIFGVFQAI